MTRDVQFVLLFIFITISIIAIICIYASYRLEDLFDQLSYLKIRVSFGFNVSEYFKKYNEMVKFRNRYYFFLSKYLKKERFKIHHDFARTIYDTYVENLSSSEMFARYLEYITDLR